MIGIDAPPRRELLDGAVDTDKTRERVVPTAHHTCAGGRYLIVDIRLGVVEDPHERSLAGDGDRAVPVLHRGIGLGPSAEHLAELERSFVCQRGAHTPAEEDEVIRRAHLFGRFAEEYLGPGRRGLDVPPEAGQQE